MLWQTSRGISQTFNDSLLKISCLQPWLEFMTKPVDSSFTFHQSFLKWARCADIQSIMSSHFVRCMLSQSDISNELYILGQCLLHISVIPSLGSFPSLPGAHCNCCSFLLTLNVYTVLITDLATRSDTINHNEC